MIIILRMRSFLALISFLDAVSVSITGKIRHNPNEVENAAGLTGLLRLNEFSIDAIVF